MLLVSLTLNRFLRAVHCSLSRALIHPLCGKESESVVNSTHYTLSFSFPFLSFTSALSPKGRAEGKEKENKRKCLSLHPVGGTVRSLKLPPTTPIISFNVRTSVPPGSYQRLDLFIQVLRVLCPNLTDASSSLYRRL